MWNFDSSSLNNLISSSVKLSVLNSGEILVRQRGTKIHAGKGVKRGGDDTLFAVVEGTVTFYHGFKGRKFVSVV